MIDLHSHLLPNIDDGSTSAERSAQVLQRLEEEGVEGVVLTPHIRAGELEAEAQRHLERRDRALGELQALAASDWPRLYLGYEIMLDQPTSEGVVGDRRFSLAGSRYYLVEFPLGVVAEFATPVLGQIAQAGVVPVVAHPERYFGCSRRVVTAWREVGAKIQVDATTLTRLSPRGRRARELLVAGLADVVASDNHGGRRTIRTAAEYLRTRAAGPVDEVASLLTVDNPQAVVEDGQMTNVPPVEIREGVMARLRRALGG